MSKHDVKYKVSIGDGKFIEITQFANNMLEYFESQIRIDISSKNKAYYCEAFIKLKTKLMKEKYCE